MNGTSPSQLSRDSPRVRFTATVFHDVEDKILIKSLFTGRQNYVNRNPWYRPRKEYFCKVHFDAIYMFAGIFFSHEAKLLINLLLLWGAYTRG